MDELCDGPADFLLASAEEVVAGGNDDPLDMARGGVETGGGDQDENENDFQANFHDANLAGGRPPGQIDAGHFGAFIRKNFC